jgi:plastocyanin
MTLVAAKTIRIDVGKTSLSITPETATAAAGDVLEFHFYGSLHSAVQGDYASPCKMGSLAGTGFSSGSVKNAADGTVRLSFSPSFPSL